MKKILCALLSVILMLFQAPSFAATNDTLPEKLSYERNVLKELGIIESDYESDSLISRAEFVKITAAFICAEVSGADTAVFNDIAESDAQQEIAALYQLGIVAGTGDKSFSPDSGILCSHACTVMLRALGYVKAAENSSAALRARNKLLKGISSEDSQLTADMMMKLLYNALFVNVAFDDINGNGIRISDQNALEVFHNVQIFSGIYQANRKINMIGGEVTADYKVLIDGKMYDTDTIYDSTYIGCNVDVLYNTDKQVIKAILPSARLQTVKLFADEIADFGNRVYSVMKDDGGIKEYKLDALMDIVYNDTLVTSYDETLMKPQTGYVLLIDNDGDGDYDLVNISEFKNLFVSGIYEEGGAAYIYDSTNNIKVKVIQDEKDMTVITDLDGKSKSVGSIREKTLISVKGSVINNVYTAAHIIIAGEAVSGVLSAYETGSGQSSLVVGSKSYQAAPAFASKLALLTVGSEYVFYLDCMGMIAAVDLSDNSSAPMAVGYVIAATENKGVDKTAKIKMLTPHNKVLAYDVSSKMKLGNTQTHGTYAELINAVALGDGSQIVPQLICYNLNEKGEISKIEKYTAISSPELLPTEFGLYRTHAKSQEAYASAYQSFFGTVMISEDTLIYSVPSDASAATDDEYSRVNIGELIGDQYYYVEAYSFGNSNLASDVVLLFDAQKTNHGFNSGSTVCVIEAVTVALNSEGESVNKVKLLGGNGAEEYLTTDLDCISNASLYNTAGTAKAEIGDVIRYSLNGNGEICQIQIIYDYSVEVFYPGDTWPEFNAGFRCVRANVYRRSSRAFQLVPYGTEINTSLSWDKLMIHLFDKAQIVVCEKVGNRFNIRLGTKSDVRSYVEDGVADKIIYHSRQAAGKTIIVYK